MGRTFRKLEVRDLRDLEKLVTESAEAIEPGLRIVDSCLRLGHARIDLVGLDVKETLALTVLGFTANEEMLLRALEAYSWCLEYPETVRRLYPAARPGRPPRVIFIAERLSDSFIRKVRQLSCPELDCLTFLHLEVDGASAVYFDPVERVRRVPDGPPHMGAGPVHLESLDQPPFIEGAPPGKLTEQTDPTTWAHSPVDVKREQPAPTSARGDEWSEVLRALVTDRAPDTGHPLDDLLPSPEPGAPREPAAEDGARSHGFEQFKGEWQQFLDRLGAFQPSQNGRGVRAAHEFLKQLGPAE